MPCRLTIALCCHNSSPVVGDALRSLALQVREEPRAEVLVIDNASDDGLELQRMVHAVDPSGTRVRILREEKLGLSAARNRAVDEALGEYVLFIDDDAVAGPCTVGAYLDDLEIESPDVIGGNVLPLFEQVPPAGMDQRYWLFWSIRYFGPQSRWLGDGEYFIGANIGARRSLLLERRFDERLGRKGASLGDSEEVFLGDSRWKRRFVAPAYVLHKVPARRMTPRTIAQRRNGHSLSVHGTIPLSRVWGGFARDLRTDLEWLMASLRIHCQILKDRLALRRLHRGQPGPPRNR